MILEYFNIFFFMVIIFIISVLLVFINYFIVYQNYYLEKASPYECGFQPFGFYIQNFEIKYYLIALLFLIFDLEIMFILPWIYSLDFIEPSGILSFLFFFITLIIGFLYEWVKGGLEWDF